ncbi:hypothetical protein EVA_10689 [gut metagenome]|uniref:Uncharacterized protein n=1 Tax=gut metagenome TaxID=749906 RepID=J9GH74_9ZZZZ
MAADKVGCSKALSKDEHLKSFKKVGKKHGNFGNITLKS